MKKILALVLAAVMMLCTFALAEASFDPASYKSEKDPSEWKIAVITKDNTANWFKRMEIGVNEFGEETGIEVVQKGPANADAASQVQVIDDMINQGYDAICVVPIDPGAIEESTSTRSLSQAHSISLPNISRNQQTRQASSVTSDLVSIPHSW